MTGELNCTVAYHLKRPCVLGEGAIYRSSDSTLHYLDCLHNPCQLHIIEVDPETGDPVHRSPYEKNSSPENTTVSEKGLRVVTLEDSVTVLSFRKNKPGYICLYYQGIVFMDEQTGKLEVLKEIIPTEDRSIRRFNDGGSDPAGRFWAAEIDVKALSYGANNLPKDYGKPLGRLWRYDPDGSLHLMEDGLVCGNGITWSPDGKTMYLNDSCAQYIYAYDFDIATGNISNKRVFKCFIGTPHEPDGMVVDSDGNLWIAMYNGYCIMVLDPQGNVVHEIKSPGKCTACTAWGGKDFNIIYGVSAYDKSPNRLSTDEGGHVFKVVTNYKGMPKYEFAG
ncbi:hypothetical protein TRVA0_001S00936 [Trichomonascus vanleenenianus]|uniref:SMP-30/gluconolactonase/LRE family protein n=1 Tax=Trichomonascus vanleenenianus TaxID=2268995 RepID=UPI003EC995D9